MATATPLILLPPSEGKAAGGDGPPVDWRGGRFSVLGDARREVRDAVRHHLSRPDTAGRLLGVRGAHLERALAEWGHLDDAPTMPAAGRYTGVVWGALGLQSLPPGIRRRALSRIVVPSGLWGLVGASDAIPAYRLKMGARVPPLGLLAAWWRPRAASWSARTTASSTAAETRRPAPRAASATSSTSSTRTAARASTGT